MSSSATGDRKARRRGRDSISIRLPANDLVELGDVLQDRAAGRTDPAQITVGDLTGTGVQDTVIATLAEARLHRVGWA